MTTAEVKLDSMEFLSADEEGGAVSRFARRAKVIGFDPVPTNYKILQAALTQAGVPVYGSTLEELPQNLILTTRHAETAQGDKSVVNVDLVYTRGRQNIATPSFGFVLGRISATIQQKKSNLDGNGNIITVSHTYPGSDLDFPNQTKTIGGTIEYMEPQLDLMFQGIQVNRRPWVIGRRLAGSVNILEWFGGGEREWMCTHVEFTGLNPDTGTYSLDLGFQHNPDTWDSTAVFIDQRNGKPPLNLVPNVGYKTIRKHKAVSFEDIIGARLQGG